MRGCEPTSLLSQRSAEHTCTPLQVPPGQFTQEMLDVRNPPANCLVGVLTAPHAAPPPPMLTAHAPPDITQDPQKLSAAIQMAAALLHQPYQ
jgi:hypothetical protein